METRQVKISENPNTGTIRTYHDGKKTHVYKEYYVVNEQKEGLIFLFCVLFLF